MGKMCTKFTLILSCFLYRIVGSTVIDMTHEFSNTTLYWPGDKRFELEILSRGKSGNTWYEINNYAGCEHGGTHIDAPSHFSQHGWRLGDIPLDNFIGPVVVIDISARAMENPDAQLLVSDIEAYEQEHGLVPNGAILFLFSGWDKHWGNYTAYMGNSDDNEATNLHFPGVHPDAAQWIVDSGKIKAVGVDTASLDYGPSETFETHQTLLGANVYGMENVKNIGLIPVSGATAYIMPMKIKEGSGGPARIIATWDITPTSTASLSIAYMHNVLLTMVLPFSHWYWIKIDT